MALGNGSGSVRSILRDRNTPGTGQSVRFFSRDAYRVISPDVSTTSPDNSANGTSEASFQQKVSHDSVNGTPSQFTDQGSSVFHSAAVTMGEANRPVTPRPTTPMSQFTPTSLSEDSRQQQTAYTDAQSLSSPGLHNLKSIIAPVPPPDNSDIFDMSAAGEHGVQAIPMAVEGATLQDGAIEVDDDDETDAIGRVTSPVLPGNVGKENIAPAHEPIRNQTVFAMPEANTSNPLLTSNTIVDKSKGKSLGRKAGEAIFNSLTNALSDNEPKSSTNPPRPSSSLGFHKIFNGNSSTPPAVGKIITMADRPSATTMNRSRSYNDHIFQRPSSVVQDSARTNRYADPNLPARPDSMIDTSAVMVYPPGFTPDCSPSKIGPGESRAGMPDPFHADARTYYTPDVGVPNSPPAKSEASNKVQHARSASTSGISTHSSNGSGMSRVPSYKSNASVSTTARSENDDMVLALRTQLTFHQELSAQYESDLSARDELVSVLSSQLSATKSELDSRTRGAKVARQKIVQLERAFHSLELAYHEMEDQVEQSRLENAERSVMDEASGEALRALHGVIAKLEKENEKLKAESTRMHLSTRERSMNVNGSGSVGVNETGMSADDAMNDRLRETQEERAAEEERHRVAELTWEEERGRLSAKVGELESLQAKLEAKESELEVLRKEVEAQWAGTERMNAKIDELLSENEALVDRANALETTNPNNDELRKQVEALKEEIAAMEARTNELEIGWTDGENKKMELEKELEEMWTMKEEITKERDEVSVTRVRKNRWLILCLKLHEELASAQEQVEQIREALKVAEARLASSDRESQLSLDNIARLESIISERDVELNEYSEKYSTQAHELDETRDQLSALRREHSRITAEYERKLADIASRHEEAHHEAENAIRERATMKVELETIKQRFQSMEEDIEKARRQVHVLRQESADQEVKITQLKQQKERDEEDKLGLNIALDSKQQELELVRNVVIILETVTYYFLSLAQEEDESYWNGGKHVYGYLPCQARISCLYDSNAVTPTLCSVGGWLQGDQRNGYDHYRSNGVGQNLTRKLCDVRRKRECSPSIRDQDQSTTSKQ